MTDLSTGRPSTIISTIFSSPSSTSGWVLRPDCTACLCRALPGPVDRKRTRKAGKSVVPLAFWFFSICGGALLTLIYGLVKPRARYHHRARRSVSNIIYVRNLMLIFKNRARESETLNR